MTKKDEISAQMTGEEQEAIAGRREMAEEELRVDGVTKLRAPDRGGLRHVTD